MTKEQGVLLSLLKQAVSGHPAVDIVEGDISWETLAKEAVQQAVALILMEQVRGLKERVPAECYQSLAKAAYRLVVGNTRVSCSQQELVDLLTEKDYRYVILKGEAAAAYYPKAELRALGDVDFLIEKNERVAIHQLLIEEGFEATHEGHSCHEVFRKPGAHLEMHWEIAGIPHGKVGECVSEFMEDVFEKRQMSSTGDFYVPAEHHHAMILLLHMQHHMLGEGLGLRHLCDWGCFVNATADKPFWQDILIPFLRKIGLLTYASVMTSVCRHYFDITAPVELISENEQLCERVMEDILSSGNFGTKDALRKSSGHLVSNRGKDGTGRSTFYYLFANLKATVYENHPVAKKWKLLYPFFALYRLCRYAWLMLIGKRDSMYKALPQAARRKAIYDELHIFEVKGL